MKRQLGDIFAAYPELGLRVVVADVGPRGAAHSFAVVDESNDTVYDSAVAHACQAFCEGVRYARIEELQGA